MGILGDVLKVGGSLVGGILGSSASKKAAAAQEQLAREGLALQERMFNRQIELQEPFRQGGVTAQNQILQLLGIGGDQTAPSYGSLAQPFGVAQFQQDPGYAFRQSEGMKALERSAAARGGLLSGSTMKGIQRFGQDLASQEYQNAFNRYQVERAARLNPLQSLMGAGQSSANLLTGTAGQYGQMGANTLSNIGDVRASSYMGSANALSNALSGIGNYFADKDVLNTVFGPSSGSSGGGAYGGPNPDGAISFSMPSINNAIARAYPSYGGR